MKKLILTGLIVTIGFAPALALAQTSGSGTSGRGTTGNPGTTQPGSPTPGSGTTTPPPPSPPWKWHVAHDFALKTGPSPSPCASGSFGVHSCSNSSRPAAISDARAVGPKMIGRPSEKKYQ